MQINSNQNQLVTLNNGIKGKNDLTGLGHGKPSSYRARMNANSLSAASRAKYIQDACLNVFYFLKNQFSDY